MTRINCIDVTLLNNKMLFSEYRELPRIFSWLESVLEKGKEPTIPEKYCLGKGHMSFFADKLIYLNGRHINIVRECLKRGFKISITESLRVKYHYLPNKYWNDWTPDHEAQDLNRKRINERLETMKGNKTANG